VTAVTCINQKGGTTSALLCQLAIIVWRLGALPEAAGSPQHDSRSRIIVISGLLWLDAEPECISEKKGDDGWIYLLPTWPSPVLQLESRSKSNSNGCLHVRLVTAPNPPWCLIHRYLSKVKMQSARAVLITPSRKTQSWFPIVLEDSADPPDLVVMPAGQEFLMKQGGGPNWLPGLSQAILFITEIFFRGFKRCSPQWKDKTNSNYSSSFAKWAG